MGKEDIIRCKDCKHLRRTYNNDFYWCKGNPKNLDGFCDEAERREDE